jgi:hypothetical protein
MKAVEAQFKTAREQLAASPISEAEKAKRMEQLQDKEDEVRQAQHGADRVTQHPAHA